MKLGYKQTEVGIIPEDWDTLNLGRLIKLQGGYSFRSQDFSDIGVPVIRISDIQNGEVEIKDATCHPAFKLSDDFIVQNGDLLVAMSGATTGKVGVFRHPKPAYQNQRVGRFVVRDKMRTSQDFVGQLVRSRQFGSRLSVFLEQGAQPNISGGKIESLIFAVPPTPSEQQAIAQALSDVDALIKALDRLIAKKRDIKQATMQQLLTGKTRLPGFSGKWEVKQLGDVVQIKKGQLITSSTLKKGYIPVIAGGKQPAYYHATANRFGRTITISASGASAGYVALYSYPIFASDCSTISESGSYSLDFIYYQLLSMQQTIYKSQTGGAQPHIHAKDLTPLQFLLPSLYEQTAIAVVLSDMDTELSALEARRDKMRALKQGMMQELLTGKTRLI